MLLFMLSRVVLLPLFKTSDEDSVCDTQSLIDSNFTLASTARDYCYENGRRYHAYRLGHYPMPNDEEEQDRLAFMHHLFKLLLGGDLYRAPILANDTSPKRILDVGTGTGIWALEMADDFPDAEIVGTDLSPIQPSWAPPNCVFNVDDAESDWTFTPEEAFDYIHSRSMHGGIADWNRFLRQAYAHTKPGGWVEIQEYESFIRSDDDSVQQAPLVLEWQEYVNAASKQFGKYMNVAPEMRGWMEDAGFVNVTDSSYKCPVGSWPKSPRLKEIGRAGRITVYEAVEPYTLALFTRVLGWSCEDAQAYVDKVRMELLKPHLHIYVVFHFVCGQRPLDG
ncbi:class I SAM-dependent methyltransferase [Aspergillus clavatus NRRL 1]|uniref:TAM domain methyltransferase, putative n=1 Tax=Aspergillus clavatus (strain ATCC 1007 / CBS 513.65 / DSM 816 / NCTC 3887 / NRRL 1 / QM 1276 / 107) TaxID=344612 RepID=A1C7S3_ASPCL|nr:TAM domain methyltransferase, putative [Aspergillus clavatus NRRL 1]EAW14444.1 TAM domain methyltransferase, putative [Aspergillus clavatus NRRL 1]